MGKTSFDKKTNDVKWAIKEYLINLTSSNWKISKDINCMLKLKGAKRLSKKSIFGEEMVEKLKTRMTKRALFISSFGKKKIWKPQKYVPSRQVVLANSIEELNNLYRIEGDDKK